MGRERFVKRYPDATEAEYEQAFAELGLSLDDASSAYNVLLFKIGDQMVLVDAGEAGRPHGGLLPESMKLAGVEPDAVTLVVITHTHGDHVQGLLADEGQPAFPNASYVLSKTEMRFWQGRIEAGKADHRAIVEMMDARGLRLIEMDEQIIPGVTAVPLPGHTPGQIGLLIESGGDSLLHLADLLHSPIQFGHPEWSPTYDADTHQSVPTRRDALGRAADEHRLALFYHLAFPGLGRVERAAEGFTWRPSPLAPLSRKTERGDKA
jgi:glyoxylase-like metal-dependent hydrolase (beta-lactamase superfamily II)